MPPVIWIKRAQLDEASRLYDRWERLWANLQNEQVGGYCSLDTAEELDSVEEALNRLQYVNL